jgi:hypothetical protein
MTLQQTVTIPDSRELRLKFRLPQAVPIGRAKVEIVVIPEMRTQAVDEEWVNPLLGLCEDSSLTVDRFLEMKREEIALEETLRPKKFDPLKAKAAHERMCGMFKTDGHEVDRFMAEKAAEKALEL